MVGSLVVYVALVGVGLVVVVRFVGVVVLILCGVGWLFIGATKGPLHTHVLLGQ